MVDQNNSTLTLTIASIVHQRLSNIPLLNKLKVVIWGTNSTFFISITRMSLEGILIYI